MPRKKRPPKLVTLDTETIGLDGALKRIAIYDGEAVLYGYTFKDVLPRIKELAKNYKVHIYIHNADFDLRKLPEIFEKGNVDWYNTKIINRKYAKVTCKDYVIHDSFKLLPMSLAKASKEFDLEHGKLDLWEEVQRVYTNQYTSAVDFLNRCDKDDPVYLKYLGYDVIALYELIIKLCEVSTIPFEKLILCLSTSTMSKYVFRNGYNGKQFMTDGKSDYKTMTQFKLWRTDRPVKENQELTYHDLEYKIREAYFGGRTEVFTPRLYPHYNNIVGFHYDVNSLYPDVCQNNYYPVSYPKFFDRPAAVKYQWEKWLMYGHGLGFLKCKVFVPEQFIPPLPSFVDKLCFLTGYLSGTWTFVELKYAIDNCGVKILEFEEMILFEKTAKVYANYMKVFTDLKEEASNKGQLALRQFCKLMANTAYGWTCMRDDDKTQLDDISKIKKYEDKKIIAMDEDMGYVETLADIKSDSIQCQVGAYVTSYARIKLLDMLRKQAAKGKVYYCDTDSIVCEKPIDKEYVESSKLGYWGLEGLLTEAVFLQPKVYAERVVKDNVIKGNYKFKGVTKSRQASFDFSFYLSIYNKLKSGDTARLLIEANKETLPSLYVAQKKGIDPNLLNVNDKFINLANKQKRKMLYHENTTEAYYMPDLNAFTSFDFKEDIPEDLLSKDRRVKL